MTPPTIAVLPATYDDLPRLVAASTSAFRPSLFDRRLFGGVSDDDYREMCTSMYASAVGHEGRVLLKAVFEGEVVGLASWRLPGFDVKARKGLQYPPGTNHELAAEMFSQKPVEETHFYLSTLAVDPRFQRRGVGAALLRWGCRKADDADGLVLYERAGFERLGKPFIPKLDPEIHLQPMYRPPLRIVRATPGDLPSLASVYRRAFTAGIVTQYCWSGVAPSALDKSFNKRVTGILEKRDKGGTVEVLAGKRGQKVVAMAYYSIEGEPGKVKKDEEMREVPEGADEERTKDLFGQVQRLVKGIEFARCAWHVLAVSPEAQGTGVGNKMMQAVLDAGKAAGLPVTLEATEEGRPMYQLAGFKDFAEVIVAKGDENVKLWPMIYEQSKE
ncbi:acetyltransferase GNAT family [Rhodotorula toruloides]|uniref:Acetyltransferase GNAT family n=1 Tax=Rhodotorula toruloides TaxID=5286 RepID=A0A511KQZ2_RHOTO|nr:acetyltransferase GNAT family [Rhodotorula toruloides]